MRTTSSILFPNSCRNLSTFANIGIVGTGVVGRTLGSLLIAKGHKVRLGSRSAEPKEEVSTWIKQNGASASAGTFDDAAKFGDLVIIATGWPGDATELAVNSIKAESVAHKIVVDLVNPLGSSDEGPELVVGGNNSAGELIQSWLPGALVVKALNTINCSLMVDPKFPQGVPSIWISGNDADAKKKVTTWLNSLGWSEVIDLGSIKGSRLMEPIAVLWVKEAMRTNKWANHAVTIIRK